MVWLFDKVKKTGQPILITRFGVPVAKIVPPGAPGAASRFGTGVGSMEILGDIVGPISDIADWEAARDPDEDE